MLRVSSFRQVLMLSFCACFLGCDSVGESHTAGMLSIQLQDSETAEPVPHEEVLLFEEPELNSGHPGIPYQSDALGRIEHHWSWLGGGGQYTVRLVVEDTAYVSLDTTATFPVRGTRIDNRLEWLLKLTRRAA
jgi:hypothetical protein